MTVASRSLKGKLEARPYNGSSAFVAASFQLAILSFQVSLSLGASESASESRVPRVSERRHQNGRASNPRGIFRLRGLGGRSAQDYRFRNRRLRRPDDLRCFVMPLRSLRFIMRCCDGAMLCASAFFAMSLRSLRPRGSIHRRQWGPPPGRGYSGLTRAGNRASSSPASCSRPLSRSKLAYVATVCRSPGWSGGKLGSRIVSARCNTASASASRC